MASEGVSRRRRYPNGRSSWFKNPESALRYKSGKQKYFAKTYLSLPRDGDFRKFWRENLIGENYRSANAGGKLIRSALGYYGPGDYRSFFKKYVPRGTFSRIGSAVGGWTGIPGMSDVGGYAGQKLANYAGFGDYSSNQIVGGGSNNQQMISVNKTDLSGDVYVQREEFVGNVVVTGNAGQPTAFQVTSYSLNPGLAKTFPWLSQIAQNFTLYEFYGLIFQYKPLFSEDAGVSSNLGKVIMCTEYDPSSTNFLTSVQMENYDYSNSSKPSCGMHHGVETKSSQQALNMQYVRTGSTTRDLIFTDIGNFQIGTEGIPLAAGATSAIIGELWVTYRVKLSRAEIYGSLLGNNILNDYLSGTTVAAALTTGTTFVKSSNNIGITVFPVSATAFQVQFPVSMSLGYFLVMFQFQSGGTVFTTQIVNTCTANVNCQFYRPGFELPGNVSSPVSGPAGTVTGTTSNNAIVGAQWIYVNSPGLSQATFQVNVSAALTNTSSWRMWVQQAPQNQSISLT